MHKNISYINSWNFFSKSLFIKNTFKDNKKLIITENNKDLENYQKILKFLSIDFKIIDNYNSLNDYVFNSQNIFYFASLEGIINIKHNKNQLNHFSINIEKNLDYDFNELTKKLIGLNFSFSEYKNPSTFSKSWDILNITSSDWVNNYQISFWWNQVEEIRNNGQIIDKLNIWTNEYISYSDLQIEDLDNFLDCLDEKDNVILDNINFSKYYDKLCQNIIYISSFDYIENKAFKTIDLEIFVPKIKDSNDLKNILTTNGKKVIKVYVKSAKVIENFINYNEIKKIQVIETKLNNLKSFETKKEIVICDDILREVFTRKRLKKNISADLDLLLKIKPGDYVVHIEHWIWVFKNIIKREIPDKKWFQIKEYIEIEYAWEDKLFVPITEVSRVNKYLWVENPKLTWLGWTSWETKVNKAKQEAEEIAVELIEIYANRKLQKWYSFVSDTKKEDAFKNSFTYNHTEDQATTIEDILSDMEKETPMDRLVVWDVWFWKTEIAFNSIYRSFLNKKQSILIVPLVVLAYEHYEKAKQRFKEFWLNIWVLTRLETEKNAQNTIKKLACWELDLVIWTHKLLSDKIIYKDLWLIVTDEEHKFWVWDKEKIKEFKATIDSLAMSATPIPRSLNMALSNIRQISILKTPPHWRQDIDTIINRFTEQIVEAAWNNEFNRNGQMFFVHNRVWSIENIKTVLKNIFPEKRIIITHWQLPWIELEKRIIAFKNKKYDILLSTTVIENWIDFSNVNTIIINNAEQFWLSQIHQLRWRVWRSDKKWYCHLLYKQENIKPETAKRLKTIVEHSYVWAWFELAMKDLEIRWGWDLLGFRQSWQSSSVWINLYLKIIEDKILELQNKDETLVNSNDRLIVKKVETKIDIDTEIYIPDDYFGSELDKINFYREVELINDIEELNNVKQNLIETNWIISNSVEMFFEMLELKIISSKYKISNIKKVWINYQIDFEKNISESDLRVFLNLDKEVKFIITTMSRLRSPTKNFENNKKFIKYMLSLLKVENTNSKIKIKKKFNN